MSATRPRTNCPYCNRSHVEDALAIALTAETL